MERMSLNRDIREVPGQMAIDNVFGEAPGQGDRGQYKNSEQTFLNISISTHYEEK